MKEIAVLDYAVIRLGELASVPGVGGNVDSLVRVRLQREVVACASGSAPGPGTGVLGLGVVTNHEEVV